MRRIEEGRGVTSIINEACLGIKDTRGSVGGYGECEPQSNAQVASASKRPSLTITDNGSARRNERLHHVRRKTI